MDNEVDILVSKVQEKSNVLFTRFSDTISNNKKKMVWVEVQNSELLIARTLEEVRKKWDDIKRSTKKRAVEVKKKKGPH